MIFYLIRFTACLAILLLFYKLYLEKESVHKLKRGYLLAALILSLVIPFITFTFYVSTSVEVQPLEQQFVFDLPIDNLNSEINYLPMIMWITYAIGVLIFGVKFCYNLYSIFYKIKHNPKVKSNRFTNVLLQKLVTPHTFFNYIFLNRQKFKKKEIPKEIFLHEQCHAQQKHSLDVLFIELLKVVFWFNPLIYVTKYLIKLNHEFLADQAVLEKGISIPKYQHKLLQFTSSKTPQLVNAINYSLIKKRFTIMKSKSSKKSIWLKSSFLIPLFAIVIYGFSDKVILQKEKKINQQEVKFQEKDKNKGVSEDLMSEYKKFMHKYETISVIDYQTYKRMVIVYGKMSQKQKKSVNKYPKSPFEGFELNAKSPNKKEFNRWKNKKNFAIWIDKKHVNNDILNNYRASDIVYYWGSFVHINARSNKFPQIYQFHLYTKKGFEDLKKELENEDSDVGQILIKQSQTVEKYKELYKTFEALKSKKPHYIYKTKAEQKVLDNIFSELGGMYFRMMRADKNKVHYPNAPILPYVKFMKNGKEVYKKQSELTPDDLKLLPFPLKRPSERAKQSKNKTTYIHINIYKNNRIVLNDNKEVNLETITNEIKKIMARNNSKKVRATIKAVGGVKMGFVNDVFDKANKAGVTTRILK